MEQLIDRINTMVHKRKWRPTGYVEAKGVFNTHLYFEDLA